MALSPKTRDVAPMAAGWTAWIGWGGLHLFLQFSADGYILPEDIQVGFNVGALFGIAIGFLVWLFVREV